MKKVFYRFSTESLNEHGLLKNGVLKNDREIERYVDLISRNEKIVGLVQLTKPLEIAKIISVNLDLCPKNASKVAVGLVRRINDGLAAPSIETNMEYPIPSSTKKYSPEDMDIDEFIATFNEVSAPGGKVDITPKFDFRRDQFPPDPRSKADEWPYDDMTKAGMDPKNKSRKRPLNMSKLKDKDKQLKKYVFSEKNKGILDLDLRLGQPGGDAGGGIFKRNTPHSRDNSTSTAGNRSWSRRGQPGWSSSPAGKEFDLPDEPRESVNDIANFEENPPVGAPIPTLNYGGRVVGKEKGLRKGFKRK